MRIKLLSIEFFFIIGFLFFYTAYFYSGDLIDYELKGVGFIFHSLALISFLIGVFIASFRVKQVGLTKKNVAIRVKKGFSFFVVFFSLVGVFVSALQVSISVSLFDYFYSFFNSEFDSEIRNAYLLPYSEGGLPGVIKVFANSTLAVTLLLCSMLFFYSYDNRLARKLKILLFFSLSMLLVKVLLSLDRITIFALVFPFVFYFFKYKLYFNISSYLLFFIVFLLMNFISLNRLPDHGILDFFFLYFYLGFSNLELVIESFDSRSYGLSTFFSPFLFIARFLKIDFNLSFDFVWVWNPAQYSVSYFYMDFGPFYIVFFFLFGYFISRLTNYAYLAKPFSSSTYFVFFYGFMSFVTVPVFRGLEIYLAIIISYFLFLLFVDRYDSFR